MTTGTKRCRDVQFDTVVCPALFEPRSDTRSVFLGGGISNCPDWQSELAVEMKQLIDNGGDKAPLGDVILINPRRAVFDVENKSLTRDQIIWEHRHLCQADAILFWFPCETLCPITLYELGTWSAHKSNRKIFVGCHPDYKRREDVVIQTELIRPEVNVVDSVKDLTKQVYTWLLSLDEMPEASSSKQQKIEGNGS